MEIVPEISQEVAEVSVRESGTSSSQRTDEPQAPIDTELLHDALQGPISLSGHQYLPLNDMLQFFLLWASKLAQ